MAVFSIHNIAIKGVAACVPIQSESNADYDWISEQERELLIKTTGVLNRRISGKDSPASELCCRAAEKLLSGGPYSPADIGIIIFVSQSKDFILPSTAIILQHRLGMPDTALAFDIPLGCSGYVYGLSVMASLMSSSGIKNGLLLTGDTSSLSLSWRDKSAYPLFGDAGAATLLAQEPGAKMDFNLQTNGNNYEAIIIPHGGSKQPVIAESDVVEKVAPGIERSKKNLWLNGFDIFNFSVTEVPPNVRELMQFSNCGPEAIDYFVMHQANYILNETIRKKLKIAPEKVPYSLKDYGNTSSASIPLTMAANLSQELRASKKKLLLSGFGVGLSWGSVILDTDHLMVPAIIEI